MATTITHDGKDYTLNMTRAGVRAAEAAGLSSSQIAEKPFTALGLLFFAALYSQYKMPLNKATGLLDDVLDVGSVEFDELFTELAEGYAALFNSGGSATSE